MNNRIHNAFESIKAERSLKNKTKIYLSENIYQSKPKSRFKYALLITAIFMIVISITTFSLYTTPVAAISIDVNPSVEIEINQFDRVISVIGFDEESTKTLHKLKLKNIDYKYAISIILENLKSNNLIDDDSYIYIYVASNNDNKNIKVMNNIENNYKKYKNLKCNTGTYEEKEEAHKLGLTVGKYGEVMKLKEIDPSLNLDTMKKMSMQQLQQMYEMKCNGGHQKGKKN